ncbi:MAG: MATE family efflux transporter, partial [Paludibacter sp.]
YPDVLSALFTRDTGLRSIASKALQISIAVYPIIGFQIVVTNFFQSIGKANISIFLSLTRQFLFLVPGLIILPPIFGLTGAWAAMPVSDGLATIVSATTILYFIRKFKRNNVETIY